MISMPSGKALGGTFESDAAELLEVRIRGLSFRGFECLPD